MPYSGVNFIEHGQFKESVSDHSGASVIRRPDRRLARFGLTTRVSRNYYKRVVELLAYPIARFS